jgi:hypothetical protein
VPPRVAQPVPEPGVDPPGHPRGPRHDDDECHDPPHLRSARREEEGPGETAVVERSTAVEQTDVAK